MTVTQEGEDGYISTSQICTLFTFVQKAADISSSNLSSHKFIPDFATTNYILQLRTLSIFS